MAYRIVVLAAVLSFAPVTSALAQEAPVTLGDFVKAITAARVQANLATARPELDKEVGGYLDTLNASGLLDATAAEIARAIHRPRLSALARTPGGLLTPRVLEAISELKGLANNDLRDALKAAGRTDAPAILAPVTRLQAAELQESIDNSVDILRKYERKFGPDSARLNGVEVFLNYGLQRVPKFGPNAAGEPGPLEAIASYSPTYMTYTAGKSRMISLSEFGLRRYFFGESWGKKGKLGLLRPAFMTGGLAVASGDDGALKWPWKGKARLGGFFSWGELKVAYVGGDNQRFMVSRQFQLIPWAF